MTYVIIGASAAGVSAAQAIRENDKKASIIVVSDESFPLYSRCLLTYLIAGTIDESKLKFKDDNFYKDNNIKTYLGQRAVSIDRDKHVVSLDNKTKLTYDKLLIATGASPNKLDIKGSDKTGVFTLRYIDEARKIIKFLPKVKTVVILGGGLVGLKDAYALRQRGKEVIVIVKSTHILSQMVDKDAADIISDKLKEHGIKIITGRDAKEILGKVHVEAVALDNDDKIECQMVIIGKGVIPNTQIASSCGIKVNDGVVVDEFLRSSDKNIFAAGDVAETYDIVKGESGVNAIWPCAIEQGEIAGLNMIGKKTVYGGSLPMNSVDFFGLGSISIGITKPKEDGYEIIQKIKKDIYKKFVLKGDRIVGMVLVGDLRPAGVTGILIKNKIDISLIKDKLLDDSFDYAKIIPLVARDKEKFSKQEYKDTIVTYKLQIKE